MRSLFAPGSSHDTIVDFQQGQDTIDLLNFFSNDSDPAFLALLNVLQSAAPNVQTIDLGAGDMITLSGISVNTLHASDFFVH